MSTTKQLIQSIPALPTRDGDGVAIKRVAGRHLNSLLDPFLLIDELEADQSQDYIGGFPSHPHRGFETITYMLEGQFRHRDHMGNEGVIGPGDVQWMTAGRGIIHSEMPEQKEGRMHAFQLWLNLPAEHKMRAPAYRDIEAGQITAVTAPEGATIKLISGQLGVSGRHISGPFQSPYTEAIVADIQIPNNSELNLSIPTAHQTLVYAYQGNLKDQHSGSMSVYGPGDYLSLQTGGQGAHLLLLSGQPLREPIAQQGPFVMNTESEIRQAIEDYYSGQLVAT